MRSEQGDTQAKTRYRTVWISDIHLGTRSCKASLLLDFLGTIETDHLFLVGDIIDVWKAKSGWHWSAAQYEVLRKFLEFAQHGTNVTFVPGNHDEMFREYEGVSFGNVLIQDRVIHELADGRRLIVLHGDQFDAVILKYRWLAMLGNHAYDILLGINNVFNWLRRKLNMEYWSLSAYLKHKTKQATNLISNFEECLADYAKSRGVDGVVCGHIHKAEIREIHDILYCNDGDWVESCTALVEDFSGNLEIVEWTIPWAELGTLPAKPPSGIRVPAPANASTGRGAERSVPRPKGAPEPVMSASRRGETSPRK